MGAVVAWEVAWGKAGVVTGGAALGAGRGASPGATPGAVTGVPGAGPQFRLNVRQQLTSRDIRKDVKAFGRIRGFWDSRVQVKNRVVSVDIQQAADTRMTWRTKWRMNRLRQNGL